MNKKGNNQTAYALHGKFSLSMSDILKTDSRI